MVRIFSRLRVAHKITLWVVGALALLTLVNSTALSMYVSDAMARMGRDRLEQNLSVLYAVLNPRQESFSLRDGKLYLGDELLDGRNDVLDAVVGAVGGVATIFKGDERIATTVMTDGKRAVGTKLAAGPVHDAVFRDGVRYIGEAVILGKHYMTVYEPIYEDATSSVVGVLFVGVSAEEFRLLAEEIIRMAVSIGAGIALLLALATFLGLHRQLRPFAPLTRMLTESTEGRYPANVPFTRRSDEFGGLARAIEAFGTAMHQLERLREERAREEQEAVAARKRDILALADSMDSDVLGGIGAMARQVNALNAAAEQLLANADATSAQAEAVAEASQQTSGNVQTVAAAAEELNATSQEIGRQIGRSSEVAGTAASRTQQVSGQIAGLVEAATRIGDVVNLINDIASQTNLLALNATIEAARAGEAGKGFAVVAGEVKSLASQTAKATGDIAQQVAAIQQESLGTADAVRDVGGVVEGVHHSADAIVVSVQQQHDAIAEITRNVHHAATGTDEINARIGQVSEQAAGTRAAADRVAHAASALAQAAQRMEADVTGFIQRIRANAA